MGDGVSTSTDQARIVDALRSERTAVEGMRRSAHRAEVAECSERRIRDLWEYDRHLWARDRERLDVAARVLVGLVRAHPHLAAEVDGWREQIWGTR